jgi:uncharacterized protein YndB with AHSA1/START domain
VPTARSSRTIAAPLDELWRVIADPHHLPRWWPRVTRVEDVTNGAFTEVMRTRKGRVVRADFDIVALDQEARMLRWEQRIEGTPFATVLRSSQIELWLAPAAPAGGAAGLGGQGSSGAGTEVTIELRQELGSGARAGGAWALPVPGFRGRLVRRAAAATIDEALDGLERISG